MNKRGSSIFRGNALRDYMESRRTTVLPRFVAPRNLMWLWALLGLIALFGGVCSYFLHVPVFAAGSAVMYRPGAEGDGVGRRAEFVVVLPPKHLGELRVDQSLQLRLDAHGDTIGGSSTRVDASIVSVQSQVLKPDVVGDRFSPKLAEAAAGESAVVRVRANQDGLSAPLDEGALYAARVEIGSRRAVSLFSLSNHRDGDTK